MSDKYALIAAEKADRRSPFSVVLMCTVLAVSTSAFYDWLTGQPSARQVRRAKIEVHVQAAFAAGRGTYGVRRVHAVLGRSDDADVAGASVRIVRDIMQEKGLRACQPRAYRTTTVRDPGAEPVVADHVGRDCRLTQLISLSGNASPSQLSTLALRRP